MLVKYGAPRYTKIMLTKLGTFLNAQPIRRAMRFVAASGEQFVVMPLREYTVLTGADAENLPILDVFDMVEEAGTGKVSGESENEERDTTSLEMNERGEEMGVSALAHLELEEEIGVEHLPL